MKFVFGLQRVLDLKKQIEEQQKIDLSRLLKKKREIESYIEDLKKRLIHTRSLVFSSSEISSLDLVLYNHYREYILQEIEEKEKSIKILDQEIERKRREVLEATKERKKIEKLKEKTYKKFLEEEKRIEQKELDEYSIYKKENF